MRIETTIEASCAPEALFSLLTTPERIPEWAGSIAEAGRRTAGELAVGAAFWNRVRFLGKAFEHEYRVTDTTCRASSPSRPLPAR